MAPNTVNAQFLPTFFRNWDKEYQSNLPQVGPDMALFWSNVYTRFTPYEADTKRHEAGRRMCIWQIL